MAIVTVGELQDFLAFTPDMADVDSGLLSRQIEAAQNHIERLLGFQIETCFGGDDQDPVPPALEHAVMQLAAWWYAQREAASEGAREVPFGVRELVAEYREYTF